MVQLETDLFSGHVENLHVRSGRGCHWSIQKAKGDDSAFSAGEETEGVECVPLVTPPPCKAEKGELAQGEGWFLTGLIKEHRSSKVRPVGVSKPCIKKVTSWEVVVHRRKKNL